MKDDEEPVHTTSTSEVPAENAKEQTECSKEPSTRVQKNHPVENAKEQTECSKGPSTRQPTHTTQQRTTRRRQHTIASRRPTSNLPPPYLTDHATHLRRHSTATADHLLPQPPPSYTATNNTPPPSFVGFHLANHPQPPPPCPHTPSLSHCNLFTSPILPQKPPTAPSHSLTLQRSTAESLLPCNAPPPSSIGFNLLLRTAMPPRRNHRAAMPPPAGYRSPVGLHTPQPHTAPHRASPRSSSSSPVKPPSRCSDSDEPMEQFDESVGDSIAIHNTSHKVERFVRDVVFEFYTNLVPELTNARLAFDFLLCISAQDCVFKLDALHEVLAFSDLTSFFALWELQVRSLLLKLKGFGTIESDGQSPNDKAVASESASSSSDQSPHC
nr:hypothetical protein Iba_chr14fCG6330 [Ipomoea batatas]